MSTPDQNDCKRDSSAETKKNARTMTIFAYFIVARSSLVFVVDVVRKRYIHWPVPG